MKNGLQLIRLKSSLNNFFIFRFYMTTTTLDLNVLIAEQKESLISEIANILHCENDAC